MNDLLNVKGLKELDDVLATLPVKIQRNVMRGGMRAGANVIKNEAKDRAPVSPPSGEGKRLYGHYMGALRDSIKVSTSSRRGVIRAFIRAGGKNKKTGADVFYAHMVEFGTAAHKIGGKLKIFGRVISGVDHPGAPARPFLRPAMDAKFGEAVVAMAQYIKLRLSTKHGIDTSDINLEGEE